jgi:hypothetical protein
MKNLPLRLLQGLLWYVCCSHIAIGAGIMVSPEFQRWMASVYGVQVEWTPQFSYLLKPLGAFMLVLGSLGVAAALDPLRHRLIVYGFIGVLLLRDLQRLVYHQDLQEAFGISPERNLATGAFFFALAVGLFVLLHLAGGRAAPAGREGV